MKNEIETIKTIQTMGNSGSGNKFWKWNIWVNEQKLQMLA